MHVFGVFCQIRDDNLIADQHDHSRSDRFSLMARRRRNHRSRINVWFAVASSLVVCGAIALIWMTVRGSQGDSISDLRDSDQTPTDSLSSENLSSLSAQLLAGPDDEIVADDVLASSQNAGLRKRTEIADAAAEAVARSQEEKSEPAVTQTSEGLIGFGNQSQAQGEVSVFNLSNTMDLRVGQGSQDSFGNGFSSTFQETTGRSVSKLQVSDIQHEYQQWAPRLMAGKLPRQFGDWRIVKTELVSLDRFGTPRVFIGDDLPTIDQLKSVQVRTRTPTEQEFAVIKKIEAAGEREIMIVKTDGEVLGRRAAPRTLVVSAEASFAVTPIVAQESCLKCHDSEVGELLGAFAFTLKNPNEPAAAGDQKQD